MNNHKELLASKVNSLHEAYLSASISLYEYISSVKECLKTYEIESGDELDDKRSESDFYLIFFLDPIISDDLYVFIQNMWLTTTPVIDFDDPYKMSFHIQHVAYWDPYIHDLIEKRFSQLLTEIKSTTTESEFLEKMNKILIQVLAIKLNYKYGRVLMFYEELLKDKFFFSPKYRKTCLYFPQVKKTLKQFLS